MLPRALAALAVVVLAGCPADRPGSALRTVELRVLAAASLGEPLRDLAGSFERARPDVRVLVSVGSSSMLERQVDAGARVDVFVSAAAGPIDRLAARGLLDAATRVDLARNELVLIVPRGSTPRSPLRLADLPTFERVAVGQQGVPVGDYAREALARADLAAALDGKLAGYPDEPAVLTAVAGGAAGAGIVYASSLVTHARRDAVERAGTVDPALHAPIVYPAALGTESAAPVEAKAFLEFLRGEEARRALRGAGFLVDGRP